MIYRKIEITHEYTETDTTPICKITVKRWSFLTTEAAQEFIDGKYTHVADGMITQAEFDNFLKS